MEIDVQSPNNFQESLAAEGARLAGASRVIGVDLNPARFEEAKKFGVTLKGTFFSNKKPRSDLPSVVEMYMNKELEAEKFITRTVPFAEINKASELILKGEGLRCVVRME